ncbi:MULTISPECIES: hypothetical protein [Nostocales]|uniref:Uncharacterized protein n=3 Tax=Nostocales TaxID=1161 RepID=A0A0C1R8C7_9CYAN|nr:hypothetical protein [Tolypothrix bouteillei]
MKRETSRDWLNLFLPLALIIGLVLLLSLNVEARGETRETNPVEIWLKRKASQEIGYTTAIRRGN